MRLGINRVLRANHMVNLILSSTTDPCCSIIQRICNHLHQIRSKSKSWKTK